MKKKKLFDRFLGCIFGGAVCDAFTLPYEGIFTKEFIQHLKIDTEKYKKNKNKETGNYGAPTGMIFATLNSAVDKNKLSDMDILMSLKSAYTEGKIKGDIFSTKTALENAIENKKWEKIPVKVGIADCSCALRSAPVGLWHYKDKNNTLMKTAEKLSRITHKDYRVTASFIIVSAAVKYLVNADKDLKPADFLKYIFDTLYPFDKKTAELIKEFKTILKKREKELALLKLFKLGNHAYSVYEQGGGVPCFSLSVVFTAIYLFIKNSKDFDKLLEDVVHTGGSINALGSITGNLWGAFNGYNALPAGLVDNLQYKKELYALTVDFFKCL